MNPFRSLHDYEIFVYTLQQKHPFIQLSTLIVTRDGPCVATVNGQIVFLNDIRLTVWELITFDNDPVQIEDYGYEFWQGSVKIAWYDSQPHPDDPNLASTHPHHKHIPPDIKHNRIPASNMRFDRPNLPVLIEEVEGLVRAETFQK